METNVPTRHTKSVLEYFISTKMISFKCQRFAAGDLTRNKLAAIASNECPGLVVSTSTIYSGVPHSNVEPH